MALSTGWSASRLAPRTGLPGTPLGAPAATPQQNPIFAQIAQLLGIKPPVVEAAIQPAFRGNPQIGPLPAPGVDYLAGAATASTPAERAANKIATAAEVANSVPVPQPQPTPGIAPRSAPGAFSQSGNIVLPNSVTRAAPTALQSGLAQALGIAAPAAVASPTIAGTPITPAPSVGGVAGLSGGVLPTGGLVPGQRPYVSPLNAIAPQLAPATNATISGVTNFNTLANQNQNMPSWLMNAIQNLNSPDNFLPVAPAVPVASGFDPLIGQTLAATEARIAAQQKLLAEENKARIARVKADAARAENEQELQVQRQRFSSPTFGGYGTGWTAPTF